METLSDQFFYQSTLTLCKHLEVEPFLAESLRLMQRYAPVETVIMADFHPAQSCMEMVAMAERDGVRNLVAKIGLTADIIKTLTGMGPPIQVSRRASASMIARPLVQKGMLAGAAPLVFMRLVTGTDVITLLFCAAEPGREFAREHGPLFTGLRPIFTLGAGNCHRFRTQKDQQEMLREDIGYLHRSHYSRADTEVIGADMGLRLVMLEARRAAASDEHLAVSGERGSGRTFLAETIHLLSARQNRPFIEINCNLIPEKQLEIQLFGREQEGVSIPEVSARGLFDRAAGGTVYLKGVERLPVRVQMRLRHIIEKKEMIRQGGQQSIACNVRIITLVEPETDIQAGLFTDAAPSIIRLPPLRERREDIPRLAAYFVEQVCRKMNCVPTLTLDRESLETCLEYDWPGNVLELRTVIERAVLLARQSVITLPETLFEGVRHPGEELTRDNSDFNLDTLVSDHIAKVMRHTSGKIGGDGGAAQLMGINPSTLRKRMRKLKIPFGRKVTY